VLVGVGQPEDEDSLSSMWRADFLRCVQAERTSETKEFQVSEDISETHTEVPGDVFEEDSPRSKRPHLLIDDRPEMSGVRLSGSFASLGKGLTRIAAGDPVHSREFMRG